MIDELAAARLITVDEGCIEVAHEALIRQWPRLREWLDESRDELRLEREVAARADEWDRLGRPDAELLRGARLERALAAPVAGTRARDYLNAGRELRDRDAHDASRRVRRLRPCSRWLWCSCWSPPRPVWFAPPGPTRRRSRGRSPRAETDLADVQRLSAEAVATSESNLPLALPLAVEAYRLSDRYETRNALLTVLQREPALLGYLGHRRAATTSVQSRPVERRRRSRAPRLRGIDLWNLATRTRIDTLPASEWSTSAFASEKSLVVATSTRVEVWATNGRTPEHTIAVPASSIAVAGTHVVMGGSKGTVALADLASGRITPRRTQGTGDGSRRRRAERDDRECRFRARSDFQPARVHDRRVPRSSHVRRGSSRPERDRHRQ